MHIDLDVYFSIFKQCIKYIHERALRLIYNDYELPFDRILEGSKEKSIHQKNTELLSIEIYKFQAGFIPQVMNDLFVTRENNYNLINFKELESSLRQTNLGLKLFPTGDLKYGT